MNERIDIAQILQGRINKTDLIGPEAHIFQVIYYENLGSGVMFSVSTHNYLLQLGMNDDAVFLIRNNVNVAAALAPRDTRTGPFLVEVVWSPTELTIMVGDRSGSSRRISVQTPPTFPPHSLHEWARRQSLIPTVTYESPVKVYETVIDQLQQLQKKIVDTNAINGFWDLQYNGNKVVLRKPKKETDIHPQIRLLLYDFELLKNMQVAPEYPIGSGRLDFLISGNVSGSGVVNVCLEFKVAHAADLAHGIEKQLPEYMARRATDFGVFGVLSFGDEYPANTSQFQIPNIKGEDHTLDFILPIAASHTGLPYLRSLIFDLSKRDPPSRL